MKYIVVVFIKFYQRFISPYKGFHCAHHVVHGEATCSNAVKGLVLEHGAISAIPAIRRRFKECRSAYLSLETGLSDLHTIDIPCDVPCDIGIGDCGGSSSKQSACDCVSFCDWPFDSRRLSKRTKRLLLLGVVVLFFIVAYVFYGRQVSTVYVTDLGEQQQSLVERLIQRDQPFIRVLVVVNGRKNYSDIIQLNEIGIETKFKLEKPLADFNFERIDILDAHLNVANKLVVISQVLESHEHPEKVGRGQRFEYRFKRRWHF